MPSTQFCAKCGASLFAGDDRCRLCRTPADAWTFVPTKPSTADRDTTPFVTMWLRPRDTIRGILDTDPSYLVMPLAAIGGVFEVLSRAAGRNAGDLLSLPALLALALVIGSIGGMIGLHIGGALVHFTGRWIGGTATKDQIRAAMAWGAVPALWGGLLWVPVLALAGRAAFSSDLESSGLSAAVLLLTGGMLIVQAGTYVWAVFTGMHSLGEAQGFSAWKALGNSVLAGAVIIVPIVGVGLILVVVSTVAASS